MFWAMRGGLTLGLVACCASAAGCGVRLDGADQPFPDGSTPNGPDAGTVDAPTTPDGPTVLGPWGTPALVAGASGAGGEDDGTLSSSTLEMIFSIADPAANNTKDLFYMSRPSPTGAWTAPVKLPFNVTGVSDETPRFSAAPAASAASTSTG
jgi:hypothetical protein